MALLRVLNRGSGPSLIPEVYVIMKKWIVTAVLAGVLAATAATVAFAGTGEWKQDEIGYWWQRSDGTYPVSTWAWIDGNGDGIAECYHFDKVGYMESDKLVDGYYLGINGAWEDNGHVYTHTAAEGID